jgi:hypothetical protein
MAFAMVVGVALLNSKRQTINAISKTVHQIADSDGMPQQKRLRVHGRSTPSNPESLSRTQETVRKDVLRTWRIGYNFASRGISHK